MNLGDLPRGQLGNFVNRPAFALGLFPAKVQPMKDPLATYLHDHLAGATFAVELLEALSDQHSSAPLGNFARELLIEVEHDRAVLQRLAKELNGDTNILKEAVSWLSEKASRLKLRRQTHSSLGTFETLEALSLGIAGKEALWQTLACLAAQDPRIRQPDYAQLIRRAQEQRAKTEAQRIEAAVTTFSPQPTAR